MPKKLETKITREYRRRGYSLKRARSIAIATMVSHGLWTPKRRTRRKGRR